MRACAATWRCAPATDPAAALALDGYFGLHPALGFLHESFTARELIVFHAVASPYRERSHFDGQDVLENGTPRAHAAADRLAQPRAGASCRVRSNARAGVALGQNVPLVMRGPAAVTSWSPSKLAALDEDTLARITDLYASDPLLSVRLADALAADAIAAENTGDDAMMGKRALPANTSAGAGPPRARPAMRKSCTRPPASCDRRMDRRLRCSTPRAGTRTPTRAARQGQLAGRLAELDAGLATLKQQLGPKWNDTAVLLITEFGRTAAINGTRGTDHGTATVAFLLGGAVAGGRVLTRWPGLAQRALYQGRDLAPTLDLRCVLKGLLADQLRGVVACAREDGVPGQRRRAAARGTAARLTRRHPQIRFSAAPLLRRLRIASFLSWSLSVSRGAGVPVRSADPSRRRRHHRGSSCPAGSAGPSARRPPPDSGTDGDHEHSGDARTHTYMGRRSRSASQPRTTRYAIQMPSATSPIQAKKSQSR